DFGDTAQKYFQALQGTPEKAEAYQADNPFGENLGNLQTVTPAKPGSQNDALLVALQSRSPQWQQIAMQNMAQQARKTPRDQFGAIMPADFTTESLAKFQASGNYGDLVPVKGKANFGNVNPGQFTPESLAVYSQSGNYADLVPRFAPVTQDIGGAKVTYDPISGRELKRYEVGLKPGEMPGTIAAQESARQGAKSAAEAQAAQASKALKTQESASSIDALATEAEKLLPKASSGRAEATVSAAKRAVGISDEKTQADAALDVIAGQLVGNVPRFEGPQSDSDRLLYEKMAGRVSDSSIPAQDRRAALHTMQRLHKQYANRNPAAPAQKPAPSKAAPAVKFLGFE
ncbi:MAG TPA: hypothetical protein VIY48_04470, partial [Candidatus Paceibacterota bacterium]